MTKRRRIYQWNIALLLCLVQTAGIAMYGQDRPRAAAKRTQRTQREQTDSLNLHSATPASQHPATESVTAPDSIDAAKSIAVADSIAAENRKRMQEMTTPQTPSVAPADSLHEVINKKVFIPNPVKATWLALIIPGGGQIYNKKFWKLPIVYGGFAGCAYALTWNGKMYKDYSQAYKDAAQNRWESTSITDLLPPGYVQPSRYSQITDILRRRKDTYRRYRDMSIFAFIGVYLISVVDAYVDAELSNFDITPDLSMRVEPAIINSQYYNQSSSISGKSVGLQCSLRF
ncbi:DUF5683 domain-containing protein [Bacteroides sp. UBA939]|uniref:DUF5683 domain-containing protein n=1 Tax=Bacteroides sp. UBA939 TaxID=1946092 RepID=UPI0025C1C7EF|nr:DUF5683 domain-containing protein [Bacteroides sp. UBA939]